MPYKFSVDIFAIFCYIIYMSKLKKITPDLEKLLLQEKANSPYLGVRTLASLLKEKHQIILSKSAIHRILQFHSPFPKKRGRTKISYSKVNKTIENCGLILLKCLDSQIGLLSHINKELKPYFPQISEDLLEKLIISRVFASLIGATPQEMLQKQGFSRLINGRFSTDRINFFNDVLSQNKPVISLKPVKENLKFAASIKLYFNNNHSVYCDAKMATFWNENCDIGYFFLPRKAAVQRIEQMIKAKTLIIGYTKSIDYLSQATFDFIQNINSGLEKIQFISFDGSPLSEIKVSLPKINLIIGYYPKQIKKGLMPADRPAQFRRVFWKELGGYFYANTLTELSQPQAKEKVMLINVPIKQKMSQFPNWSLLISPGAVKDIKTEALLKQYLYFRPYPDISFIEEMEIIEKSLLAVKVPDEYLLKILPEKLAFGQPFVFFQIGQILSALFKELIWGWEPKNSSGCLSKTKTYIEIAIKNTPRQAKIAFNQACLYIDNCRAFLV